MASYLCNFCGLKRGSEVASCNPGSNPRPGYAHLSNYCSASHRRCIQHIISR